MSGDQPARERSLRRIQRQLGETLLWPGITTALRECAAQNTLLHAAPAMRAVADLGSCHAGPFLVSYVLWILDDAQRRGIRHLYFLARDGQILLDIARRIQSADRRKYKIELHYLHASRRAWFAPSVNGWQRDLLERILDEDAGGFSASSAARRLGFPDLEAMLACWPQLTEAAAGWQQRSQLIDSLLDTVSKDAAARHFQVLRHEMLEYLEQQGLTASATDWAIVDLGWRGRMQESLARCLAGEAAAGSTSRGYYLALLENPHWPAGKHAAHCLWPGNKHGVLAELPGPATLIELLCQADHGSTTGYARDAEGCLQPVFTPEIEAPLADWGWATYRAAVLAFTDALIAACKLTPASKLPPQELSRCAFLFCRELFRYPPPAIAQCFASMPFSDSADHDDCKAVAAPASLLDSLLWALTLGKRAAPPINPRLWPIGSIARCGHPLPLSLFVALKSAMERLGLTRRCELP